MARTGLSVGDRHVKDGRAEFVANDDCYQPDLVSATGKCRTNATDMRSKARLPPARTDETEAGPLVSAPGCLAVGDLLREFPRPALRQVRLVVLALAFHRDSLLERRRLPSR